MGTPLSDTSKRPAGIPVRPSGVMPSFRGSVSLPARALPPLRLARAEPNDDELWRAALEAAKQRAEAEEEERAWQQAMARARAVVEAEEREWAALRARALANTRTAAPRRPAPRVVSWP